MALPSAAYANCAPLLTANEIPKIKIRFSCIPDYMVVAVDMDTHGQYFQHNMI